MQKNKAKTLMGSAIFIAASYFIKVESPQIKFQIGQWQQAQSQSYQSLIEFSCNPDDGDYQQIFVPNIQPLQGLIGYLSADWSK